MRPLLFPVLVGLAALTARAEAQTVTGSRNLDFGIVIRGVPNSVSPGDPVRSGRFYVRYQLNRQVQVRLTLPNNLTRTGGGGSLPISFGATDAVAQGTAGSSVPVTFDPRTTQTFTLQTSPDFYLNLGGRVAPTAAQATGKYTGNVTLTVTFF
ncbi:MAG TPA: hypothetical protein VG817_09015 [Gemmatimonadales bacterium]|nr:hypothetical protein [Gemmatimonadales bacterium]